MLGKLVAELAAANKSRDADNCLRLAGSREAATDF